MKSKRELRAREVAKSQLPRLVADLPRSTALAIYVPHVDVALTDLHHLFAETRALDLDVHLLRALGLDRLDRKEAFAAMLTPAGLASAGIDVGGSMVIVPPLMGEPILLAFELQDRPRFEAFIDELAGGSAQRVSIGGEQGSVLGPESDAPLACLARKSIAYCQLGATSGGDPISALRGLASTPAGATFGSVAAIGRSYERLREGAHVVVFASGEAGARLAPELALEWAERNHRFEGRKKIVDRANEIAPRLKRMAETLEGAAGGLYLSTDRISFEVEAGIAERGVKVLQDLAVADAPNGEIARWFDTPALARMLIRVRPERAEAWLKTAGIEVPPNALTGTMSLLMFGLDSECSAAKHAAKQQTIGWAFMLPSAIAVGLRGAPAADAMQAALVEGFEREVPVEVEMEKVQTERSIVRGHAFGSAFEVRVLDQVAFFGTGPGSGAAALRRFGSLPATGSSKAARSFFHAAIHPRAIDAVFDAGNISRENRRELVAVEALRRRVRPLFQEIEAIELGMRAVPSERRVTLDLEVRH